MAYSDKVVTIVISLIMGVSCGLLESSLVVGVLGFFVIHTWLVTMLVNNV